MKCFLTCFLIYFFLFFAKVFALTVKQNFPVTFVVPEFTELRITQASALYTPHGKCILYFEDQNESFPICHLDSETKPQYPLFLKLKSQQTASFKVVGNCNVQITGYLKNNSRVLDEEETDYSFLNFLTAGVGNGDGYLSFVNDFQTIKEPDEVDDNNNIINNNDTEDIIPSDNQSSKTKKTKIEEVKDNSSTEQSDITSSIAG